METRYKIFTLSARALIACAEETTPGFFRFHLNRDASQRVIKPGAPLLQNDCALFYQIMKVLHPEDGFRVPQNTIIPDLSDQIIYMDFYGIFDRRAGQKYLDRQKRAEAMFRPEGITLDLGSGPATYVAFERSGSMSRNATLSFIRAELYEPVRRRIMLDLRVGQCQLSKLYAYNGLMLSGGTRVTGIGLTKPHRVIVVDNPTFDAFQTNVITVEGEPISEGEKRYRRVEGKRDITVTRFDGEGLIASAFAKIVDKKYCGRHVHASFQVRLPFVKGMLHAVDFHDFLKSAGCAFIRDIYGEKHPIDEVDVILTKSMFKGYGWLKENGKTWGDYLEAIDRYDHALYITNVSKEKPEAYTELNYQFLTTLSMTADEFRPADLPAGWEHSPDDDPRRWVTKATEQRYYDLCANEEFRIAFMAQQHTPLGKCVKLNPLFVRENVCAKQFTDMTERLLKDYSLGRLLIAGDNRYLSGDLMEFLSYLIDTKNRKITGKTIPFFSEAITIQLEKDAFYAPGAVYEEERICTLLRNPHISRNEEIRLSVLRRPEQMRKHYLGKLTDVVMVGVEALAAQRLGGADYDGDMIKTISDPIVNECVKRNYFSGSIDHSFNIPLLYIPAEDPVLRDADNWYDRFVTVRDTFSNRIGQLCNTAFDRSVIAYDENLTAEEKKKYREETELLAILTGLEIDAAKSGVRPYLDDYFRNAPQKSAFLRYKTAASPERRAAWYELTPRQKKEKYIRQTDWDAVTSNVEKLPYYAYLLEKHTPKLKPVPAEDRELFSFARKPDWVQTLDRKKLSAVKNLIAEYERCLSRIRACRAPIKHQKRQSDINRILYSRGQEEQYDSDMLYARFSALPPEQIAFLRREIVRQEWHLMKPDERVSFLQANLPDMEAVFSLLIDFRFGGYRVLGDLICDIDDENNAAERKQLLREKDSFAFTEMMRAYEEYASGGDYKSAVAEVCRRLMKEIVRERYMVRYLVAIGKRNLLWELVPDLVPADVWKGDRHAE